MSEISEPNLKVVALRSGNRCAFPNCQEPLVATNGKISGEIAHIKGLKPGSPRHDPTMTDAQRNHFDNLLFLCPNHHTEIDKTNAAFYTPEKLRELKANHERWASEQWRKQMGEVRFAELKVITDYLAAASVPQGVGFDVIPIKDKIRRNSLSAVVEAKITLGLCRVSLVEKYIQHNPDAEFGNRLRCSFAAKYECLKGKDGLTGDELFCTLWQFACGGSADFSLQAAGLTVLVYLFQACDVFEK